MSADSERQNIIMISILINNHNYGNYVGEAIDSVLMQDYKEFEIIVVDGASTDNSRAVIMDYVNRYPDIITVVLRNGSGQAAAINAGFLVSKGNIIALLDSDDAFMPGKLSKIADLHKNNSFVGTMSRRTDGNDHDITSDAPNERQQLLKKYGFIYTYELTTSCISMTRELASKILPMPEEGYTTYADAYIKVLAQYYDNIYFHRQRLSLYRIHEKNAMATKKDHRKMNNFLKELYERVKNDINQKLCKEEKPEIPELTNNNYIDAFRQANKSASLRINGSYAVYGVGLNSYRLLRVLRLFKVNIPFAIDSNIEKIGTVWESIPVISPKDAVNRRNEYDLIIVGATFYGEISMKLTKLGLKEDDDYVGDFILNDY